jgi:serine/threonine protein kinase
MFDTFPFNKLETFKFSLLCHPFVYQKITEDDCEKLLTTKGDFVIDLGAESDVLYLYLRCNGSQINLFTIKICVLQNPQRIGFSFGDKEFTTLPRLTAYFSKHRFHFNGEKMRLKSAIYRNFLNGSFGYGTVMKFNDGHKAFVRSLNSSFTKNLTKCSNILEDLLQLKHDNICQIRDYEVCERGDGLPAVIVVRCDCYVQNIQEFFAKNTEAFPAHQYIFWFYQVTSALAYLRENEVTCKMLSLHSCLLDHQEKIKLTDFWSQSDESQSRWWLSNKALTIDNGFLNESFMRNDLWRNVSPEVLLGHQWTEQSFIWTIALLFQQILIHGKRPNRVGYSSLIDFLNAGGKDDAICFPKESAPALLTKFLGECLQQNPDSRPTFTETQNIINLHYNRCKIVNFFNRF